MARDFTPQHKTALKKIIDDITFDSVKFSARADQHVYTNEVSELDVMPLITISNGGYANEVEDTAYNKITNTYTLRVFYMYSEPISVATAIIDELISLIQTQITDYMWGVDGNWEHMNFGTSGSLTDTGGGVVYKEMTINVINRELRTSNIIP